MKLFKKEPQVKFMEKRFYAFGISMLIIVAGIAKFFLTGFNLGIEFTGGTLLEVNYAQSTEIREIRSYLSELGYGKAVIQKVSETGPRADNKYFIKIISEDVLNEDISKERALTRVKRKLTSEANRGIDPGNLQDLNQSSETSLRELLEGHGFTQEQIEETLENIRDVGLVRDYTELQDVAPEVLDYLKSNTYLGQIKFEKSESIGPKVGKNLRTKATLAAVWALIGMLVYIAFRFAFIYGMAAVITLFHDVLVVLSVLLFFNVELSLAVGAALLTIIGYSLNDTIVVFDRVRDNLSLIKRKKTAGVILNRSINQTLSRTLVTSMTTLLTMLALFLFGGEVLHWFALTMIVGIMVGTYSSIFQSCSWLMIWRRIFMQGMKKKKS